MPKFLLCTDPNSGDPVHLWVPEQRIVNVSVAADFKPEGFEEPGHAVLVEDIAEGEGGYDEVYYPRYWCSVEDFMEFNGR